MSEFKVALYPILGVTGDWLDEPFDLSQLPFTVVPNVTVEDAKTFFNETSFELWKDHLAKRELESLQRVRFAIVCRYKEPGGRSSHDVDTDAELIVRRVGVCLRLIRPMQQDASFIRGKLLSNATLDIQHFEIPHETDVPAVQKLFRLRNRDLTRLQNVIAPFLEAVRGDIWKFRMALEFHDWGHFSHLYWKGRFSLWCSAIEALYTSNSREHKGSLVAKERIKWFLGPKTRIYEPGDIQDDAEESAITIEEVVDDLYELRNGIAHGDKTPDKFFETARTEYGVQVCLAEVLTESASRIIRASLLRILENNLLKEFADGPASEAYFGAQELTRSALVRRSRAQQRG